MTGEERFGPLVDGAATFLVGLRRERRQVDGMPAELRPPDLETGYAVQARLVDELLASGGGRLIGYKIACTNVQVQALYGVDAPIYGRLLSASSYASPARLSAARFTRRIIEPEFAFVMRADAPPARAPYDRARIAALVATALPAIEIVDHRFAASDRFDGATLAADNAIHGAWVHGEPCADWRGLDLAAIQVRLYAEGKVVRTGSGALVLGHPLDALAWLANALAARGAGLAAGDRITTGTCTEVYPAAPGERVVADFGPIGRAEVRFEGE